MVRFLYISLLRLHPRGFRQRFGDEMLDIFDQTAYGQSLALLADAFASLLRQWLLRPEVRTEPVLVAQPPADVPLFHTFETSLPRRGALINGGILSLAFFSAVIFSIGHSRSYPVWLPLIGTRHPRPHVLPVDRASVSESEPTTEVKVSTPADPWRQFASHYFKIILVLRSLDADEDLIISASELKNAYRALMKLDLDGDGKLSPAECGQRFGIEESQLDPDLLKWARVEFMRFNPVLDVLDADHDGQISTIEIENSPRSLRKLDINGDGSLTAAEVAPESMVSRTESGR